MDYEDEEDLKLFKAVEARDSGEERSLRDEMPAIVAVRKSFPEAWIFDGGLSLGYKIIF